jgi:hypothetical protein
MTTREDERDRMLICLWHSGWRASKLQRLFKTVTLPTLHARIIASIESDNRARELLTMKNEIEIHADVYSGRGSRREAVGKVIEYCVSIADSE